MLELIYYPNPILKQKCREVTEEEILNQKIDGHDIETLIPHMFKIMKENGGVGLACPQIGLPIQLFIIEYKEIQHVIINPKFSKMRGEELFIEGCLSIPNVFASVLRARKLTVTFDVLGEEEKDGQITKVVKKKKITIDEQLADIFQHEYDHLQGKLFIDKASMIELEKQKDILGQLELEYTHKFLTGHPIEETKDGANNV